MFLLLACIRREVRAQKHAVYTFLAYDTDGNRDILGLWISETESQHMWVQIFDELKCRGVEDILFMAMDGLTGLEEGVSAVFPKVIVHRCILHILRNSLKYISSKHYKKFTAQIKKVYGAPSLKIAMTEFEKFSQEWTEYPGAIKTWTRNFEHLEKIFDCSSCIRRIVYTTNAVESVHSSFRKVTPKWSVAKNWTTY